MGIFGLLIAAFGWAAASESNVLVLSDADIEQVIEEKEKVLVEFYAPWCGHCQQLAPDYERTAQIIEQRKGCVSLAKIDATANPIAAQKYAIESFPTLLYFDKGKYEKYTEGRSAQEMSGWLLKKCGILTTVLSSKSEVDSFLQRAVVACLLFAPSDSQPAAAFDRMAKNFQFLIFAIVESEEVRQELGAKEPELLVLNQKDEIRSGFTGPWEERPLLNFFLRNHFDLVANWTAEYQDLIYKLSIPTLMLFRTEDTADLYNDTLRTVAKEIRKDLLVFTCDKDNAKFSGFIDELGVAGLSQPFAMIFHPQTVLILKYIHSNELSSTALIAFAQSWKTNSAEQFYKSEDRPKQSYEGAIKVLTGKTFEKTVNDPAADVIVLVCADSQHHCKLFTQVYKEVAHFFRGNRKVQVVKIDGELNDIKGVEIKEYPTVLFYPANNKEALVFDGEKVSSEIIAFAKAFSGFRKNTEL